jgi:hypothetical protein
MSAIAHAEVSIPPHVRESQYPQVIRKDSISRAILTGMLLRTMSVVVDESLRQTGKFPEHRFILCPKQPMGLSAFNEYVLTLTKRLRPYLGKPVERIGAYVSYSGSQNVPAVRFSHVQYSNLQGPRTIQKTHVVANQRIDTIWSLVKDGSIEICAYPTEEYALLVREYHRSLRIDSDIADGRLEFDPSSFVPLYVLNAFLPQRRDRR